MGEPHSPRPTAALAAAFFAATLFAGVARSEPLRGDTKAPTRPREVVVERKTQASVALAWRASRDDVRVVAYRLWVDGNRAGATRRTRVTLTRLACGRRYAVAVAAVDRAGNVSRRAVVRAGTASCRRSTSPPASSTPSTPVPSPAAPPARPSTPSAPTPPPPAPSPPAPSPAPPTPAPAAGTSPPAPTASGGGGESPSSSTDTTPPSPPASVGASTTQTTATLSWASPGADAVAYGMYNGATLVQSTATTSATVTGLTCGTTYTLGVDAADAAGNRSTRATLGVTTAACASSAADRYVSTTGSDAGSCGQLAPCRTFNRAYQVAQQGEVVEVAAGTYPDQDLRFDATKTGSADVVFRPASGATVTVGQLDFGSDRFTGGASHVTVKDMTVTGDVSIPGCGSSPTCPADAVSPGNDLTFENLRVKGPYAFYCASCSNVSILGGTWGPDTYQCRSGYGSAHPEIQSAPGVTKRAHAILIDGVTWQNFARCTSSDHTECLQAEPADDFTIRNSIFKSCDTIVVNLANDLANANSAAGYRAPNNVLIENNFFDTAKDSTGGPTYYALNIRECTNCTIRYNSWTQEARMPTGEVALNVSFIANVGPMGSWNCRAGITYAYNVWEGGSCSATDRNVANAGFVNRAAVDLHLAAGSPAIDAGHPSTYPTRDIDGHSRPSGGRADAGADER